MENSTKIIETINKYFPKKEVFTEISGLEILDNICKRYDVKGASCKLYSAKYSVSFSQNQRTTFLYCVEIEGQQEKFYFEKASKASEPTMKCLLTELVSYQNSEEETNMVKELVAMNKELMRAVAGMKREIQSLKDFMAKHC